MTYLLRTRNFAQNKNIDPKRLIFAKHMPLDEHLKRLQLADLVLDLFLTMHTQLVVMLLE